MRTVIIRVDDDVEDRIALAVVTKVVLEGKVSENKHGGHYTWHSVFHTSKNDLHVSVTPKRHKDAADSFTVHSKHNTAT